MKIGQKVAGKIKQKLIEIRNLNKAELPLFQLEHIKFSYFVEFSNLILQKDKFKLFTIYPSFLNDKSDQK